MQLDFWNNPLVVSAFRVQYRRGGLFSVSVVYLLVLGVIGAALDYYSNYLGRDWPRIYFLLMVGGQFLISGLIAMNATNVSLRTEVVKQTLDFQRITALSPAEILIGKLLGEPALAYLLAISTFPLAVWCWLMGVPGLTLDVLLLMYLNLATSTLMCGALGLVSRLEPAAGKQAGTGGGAGLGVLAFILLGAVNVLTNSGPIFGSAGTWHAPIAGLFTPVPVFVGLIRTQDAWQYSLPLFGLGLPYLLVTPLSQLLVAFLCFHLMERRMINPANPPFSKRLAYLTLALLEVVIAAMLFTTAPAVASFGPHAAAFCVSQLLLSLWLVTGVTPWRESLLSWVWRFRGRRPRLLDWWLGDRSENGLVLVTFAVVGLLINVLLVLLPEVMASGWDRVNDDLPVVLLAPGVTALLLLSLGTVYQWFVFIAGRYGKTVFVGFLMLADILPHGFGSYYDLPLLLALSPSAHAMRWLESSIGPPPNPLPLVLLYGTALIVAWTSLRWRIGRLEESVDRKLQKMGVAESSVRPGLIDGS